MFFKSKDVERKGSAWLKPSSNFFSEIIPAELTVFLLSMMPIIELRGGIVAAKLLNIELLPAMIICFIGTILPTPFILLFIRKIFDWMRNTRFVKLVNRLEEKGKSKFAQIEKYETFGLLIFVAIRCRAPARGQARS